IDRARAKRRAGATTSAISHRVAASSHTRDTLVADRRIGPSVIRTAPVESVTTATAAKRAAVASRRRLSHKGPSAVPRLSARRTLERNVAVFLRWVLVALSVEISKRGDQLGPRLPRAD